MDRFYPRCSAGLNVAIRSLTHPGDEVILQEPVYYPFFPAVTGSGCQIVNNGLKRINDRYEMDFEDLESKFLPRMGMMPTSRRIKAMILCNPHNPVGRLWNREELTRMGEIAIRHGVIVISDEIHCEILFKGQRHTPFASISEEFEQNCIVCMAPSKTFNLAGLEVSSIIIPNKKLRNNFAGTRTGHFAGSQSVWLYRPGSGLTVSGMSGWIRSWIICRGTWIICWTTFAEKIPRIKVIPPQGTYLIWLDCHGTWVWTI